MKIGTFVLALALGVAGNLQAQTPTASTPATAARDAELRSILQAAPMLPFVATPAAPTAPAAGWELGMVSWVAADPNGAMYMLQRGDKADPIIAFDREKRVVRSWGKGLYTTPHALRVDPPGNIWTTDAKTSMVYKFAPDGRMLLEISVGGQPADCTGAFCGTTDVAFAPNGNVFIADGYRNARILEYTPDGRKLREWGTPGTGPGQFRLPHSIVIDEQGIVYVADRENGRVQRFDLTGRFLGEWPTYGYTYGLELAPGAVWLATQLRNQPAGAQSAWLIKVDRQTGAVLSYVNAYGIHGMHVLPSGEILYSPGPDQTPQWLRLRP